MLNSQDLKPGTPVYYKKPFKGSKPENGIIKSLSGSDNVFVVYHCGGEWEYYKDYTAARTPIKDLYPGWVDKDGRTPLHQELADLKTFGLCEGL